MRFDDVIQEMMNKTALKQADAMHKIGDNMKGIAHVTNAYGAEQNEHMDVSKIVSLLVNVKRMVQINAEHGANNFAPQEIVQQVDQALHMLSGKQ